MYTFLAVLTEVPPLILHMECCTDVCTFEEVLANWGGWCH